MRCPTLADLPAPPPGKTGWPWTAESPQLPDTMPDGRPWPRISIVTPSFNQGQFIEETIRSVLLQGYPNLEYLIIDGRSTDSAVEIIKKYEPWLRYWVSENDRGQAHAINKGLDRATGEIAAYLNSDDFYLQGALRHVGEVFDDQAFDIFIGMRKKSCRPELYLLRRSWWQSYLQTYVFPLIVGLASSRYEVPQECVFWGWKKYDSLRFDETYHFCLDAKWFITIFPGALVVESTREIGVFRAHPESKSATLQQICQHEHDRIVGEVENIRADKDVVRRIVSKFKHARRRAWLGWILAPNRDFTFNYTHPNY